MAQASSPKEKHVFLHYTQAELDRNYDQRGWVSNANEVIARYISASKEVRSTLTYRTEAYGDHPDEQMDIFRRRGRAAQGSFFCTAERGEISRRTASHLLRLPLAGLRTPRVERHGLRE